MARTVPLPQPRTKHTVFFVSRRGSHHDARLQRLGACRSQSRNRDELKIGPRFPAVAKASSLEIEARMYLSRQAYKTHRSLRIDEWNHTTTFLFPVLKRAGFKFEMKVGEKFLK